MRLHPTTAGTRMLRRIALLVVGLGFTTAAVWRFSSTSDESTREHIEPLTSMARPHEKSIPRIPVMDTQERRSRAALNKILASASILERSPKRERERAVEDEPDREVEDTQLYRELQAFAGNFTADDLSSFVKLFTSLGANPNGSLEQAAEDIESRERGREIPDGLSLVRDEVNEDQLETLRTLAAQLDEDHGRPPEAITSDGY